MIRIDLFAYGLESGELRYRGLHTQRLEGAEHRVQERFTDLAGRTVLRADARYRAADLAPLAYRAVFPLLGREERIDVEDGRVVLSLRERGEADVETAQVPLGDGTLFSATTVFFILRRWERLAAGEAPVFPLLVPGRLARYDFRVQREAPGAAGGADAERVVMRMEPDDLLLRSIVNPVRFVLESKPPHRLLEFRGRTPLRDADGDAESLRIAYRYRGDCADA